MTITRHAYAIAGLITVLSAISLSSAHYKAPGSAQAVLVTNNTSSPVPVVGGVAITNTTANPIPTAPQGTTQVAGNVAISNTLGNPVNTVDVRESMRTPINVSFYGSYSDGVSTVTNTMYIVPAGKRFVLTDCTTQLVMPQDEVPINIRVADTVNSTWHSITMFQQANMATGAYYTGGMNGAHLTFEAGHGVALVASRSPGFGNGSFHSSICGYVEDVN